MRQFDSCQSLRQQQQQQQQHPAVRTAGRREPARPAAAAMDETLDQAAALWPTRRIRSFFLLLDPSAAPSRR